MKRVNVLNLGCYISERNVIKKILSYLNKVDGELVLCAYNTKRRIPSSLDYLKKYAKYGYTDLLFMFTDDVWDVSHLHAILDSAAEGGYDTFVKLKEKYKMKIHTHHYCMMARGGHLKLLKSLNPFRLDHCVAISAAEGGHLDVLKYLKSIDSRWDERTCRVAAKERHFDVLVYAINEGCPCDSSVIIWAVYHGDLKMLQWAINKGCIYDQTDITNIATRRGHTHILQWTKDYFTTIPHIDNDAIVETIERNNLDCLKWLFANYQGYQHKKRFCTMAAKFGHFEMFEWLRSQGCPCRADIVHFFFNL
jgi:hypothetical protein